MDNKKINSHTDPIFKKHNLLKVEDIFKLSCLKLHYKIENNLVAPYLSSLLVRNWTVHQYATRNNEVRMVHPKFQTHKNCLRYFLPVLIRETPDNLLTQMFRFTISTFKSNLKKFYINQYPAVCMKHVCQPCGRLPYWTPSPPDTMTITSLHNVFLHINHFLIPSNAYLRKATPPPVFFAKKERNNQFLFHIPQPPRWFLYRGHKLPGLLASLRELLQLGRP